VAGVQELQKGSCEAAFEAADFYHSALDLLPARFRQFLPFGLDLT
jgi:hypothetical protein